MGLMVELFFLGMQLSEHSKCEDAYGEDVMYSWVIFSMQVCHSLLMSLVNFSLKVTEL